MVAFVTRCGFALVGIGVCAGSVAAEIEAIRTVADSNMQAPGLGLGVGFGTIFLVGDRGPVLNSEGLVAFYTRPASGGGGIYSYKAAGFPATSLLRSGDETSIVPYQNIVTGIVDFDINNVGQIVFGVALRNLDASGTELLTAGPVGPGGAPAPILNGMVQAPGTPEGVMLTSAESAVISDAHIVFSSDLAGPGVTDANSRALFRRAISGNDLGLVARFGVQAPGLPEGVRLESGERQLHSEGGDIAFYAEFAGGDTNSVSDEGFFVSSPEGTRVIRGTDQAAGLGEGVFYQGMYSDSLRLNDAGQIAFHSDLNGTGVNINNLTALFAPDPTTGELTAIARSGDQAPGLPAGAVYRDFKGGTAFTSAISLNNDGRVAFAASLIGTGVTTQNDSAVFAPTNASGALGVLAREGDQAPGLAEGTVYSSFFGAESFAGDTLLYNVRGDLAIIAELTRGTNVFEALYASSANGELVLIAAEGELFDVNDDPAGTDRRTIERFLGGIQLNDLGQLMFGLEFTDGTEGLFVASIVPAPGAGALLCAAGVFAARRRRA